MNRLLCIISSMDLGGAETFLMKLYRVLDKIHYQFDFCICSKNKGVYEDEITSMGGKIYRITSKTDNIIKFKRELFNVIKNNGYKNVLRITSNAAGFLDLRIAKKAGSTNTIARSSNASDGNGKKLIIAHRIGKLLWMKYVDTMIAPSDLAGIYTFGNKNYSKGKVYKIYNGLDLSFYKYDEVKRKNIRLKYNIPNDYILVGHIGRFSLQKNHKFLLKIFNEYHKRNFKSVLLLIGQGELEIQIKNEAMNLGIGEYVIFAGVQKDIPSFLSAMDVFVFPSFYEGMPNTVIEAQSCNLPCIISDSITREASVTPLIFYESINSPVSKWADDIFNLSNIVREEKHYKEIAKYDITSVCSTFCSLVFRGE